MQQPLVPSSSPRGASSRGAVLATDLRRSSEGVGISISEFPSEDGAAVAADAGMATEDEAPRRLTPIHAPDKDTSAPLGAAATRSAASASLVSSTTTAQRGQGSILLLARAPPPPSARASSDPQAETPTAASNIPYRIPSSSAALEEDVTGGSMLPPRLLPPSSRRRTVSDTTSTATTGAATAAAAARSVPGGNNNKKKVLLESVKRRVVGGGKRGASGPHKNLNPPPPPSPGTAAEDSPPRAIRTSVTTGHGHRPCDDAVVRDIGVPNLQESQPPPRSGASLKAAANQLSPRTKGRSWGLSRRSPAPRRGSGAGSARPPTGAWLVRRDDASVGGGARANSSSAPQPVDDDDDDDGDEVEEHRRDAAAMDEENNDPAAARAPRPSSAAGATEEPALLVVHFMEWHLRILLGLLAAYLLGVRHGALMTRRRENAQVEATEEPRVESESYYGANLVVAAAGLVLEYVAVAWATCVLILVGTRVVYRRSRADGGGCLRRRQPHVRQPQYEAWQGESEEEEENWTDRKREGFEPFHHPRPDLTLPLHAAGDYVGEATPLLAGAEIDVDRTTTLYTKYGDSSLGSDHQLITIVGRETAPSSAEEEDHRIALPTDTNKRTTPSLQMPHPALEALFIMDMKHKTRVVPNDVDQAYVISNEYFEGRMLALIRTPDDGDNSGNVSSANLAAQQYFSDKQRRFEFQFQVRLNKVPTGRVYFGVQLNDPVKLGVIQRAFVSAAMAFMRTTNPSFYYSFGSSSSAAAHTSSNGNLVGLNEGEGEAESSDRNKPIMAFPVEEGMNRVVITPPGQTPPALGGEIHEDPDAMKKRRKGVEWNLDDTYTLALWSAYVDFLDWRCLNLPGIRPFQLEGVVGVQPLTVVLYEEALGGAMKRIFDLELSNVSRSVVGPIAREWMALTCASTTEDVPPTIDAGTVAQEDGMEAPLELDTVDADEPVDVVEEERLAALGEGIYVESGDRIVLRELLPQKGSGGDAFDKSSFVTYAGGFCVLQEDSGSTIIIEKVGRRRKGLIQSKLIKSGDAVMFRLLTKKADGSDESRFLSIHRGWWLKWVPHVPTKNGVFTIHTHEFECSDHEQDNLDSAAGPEETQQSYLTWGNSFYLRHKRWSKYEVGVAGSVSSTYGGRLLGLYSSKGNYDDDFGQFDEFESQGDAGSSDPLTVDRGRDKDWMKPLYLRAFEAAAATISPSVSWGHSGDELVEASRSEDKVLTFSSEALRMDVPAWVEVLNRKDRVLQLTYAVRVSPQAWFDEFAQSDDGHVLDAFVRFRTGRQLSHLMRAGQQWRTNTSPRRSRPQADLEEVVTNPPAKLATPPRNPSRAQEITPAPPLSEEQEVLLESDSDSSSSSMSGDWLVESGEDLYAYRQDGSDAHFDAVGEASNRTKRKMRRRKIIGTIASKSKTVVRTGVKVGKDTGKSVVRSSVMVGKGTVNAGKAIIAPIAKQRPLNEPTPSKGPGLMTKKRKEKDFGAAITRSMKRFDRMASRHAAEVPVVIAGELSALEQSCRTVSSMLTRMSSLPPSDAVCERFSSALAQEVAMKSDQDSWFLGGSAVQLGVKLSSSEKRQKLVHDAVVARCLWESHWREEWCGIFETSVVFYQPLSNSPCLELLIDDIQSVREVHDSRSNPLPGFHLLALETAWMCRYAAFSNVEKRSSFKSCMEDVIAQAAEKRTRSVVNEKAALWEARLWQDFASSAKSSEGKWAKIVSGIHQKSRLVLNNRRMVFDVPAPCENPVDLVADLLSTSLSFSKLGHLKEHPELLVAFLDATSQLRRLPLQDFDLTSADAFCFFVNLYHCLLQHALLLSVNGPLTKKSFPHFMRTSCYELGGDVFSLAELHACVIRGNMSRPVTSKPPAVEPSKPSSSHRYYALGYTNPRVNFVLSTGDLASPSEVTILSPDHFMSQLNEQCASFLRRNLTVDVTKRLVVLPKVCDVYRHDFFVPSDGGAGGSSTLAQPPLTAGLACLRYCLSFLDPEMAAAVRALLHDEASIVIRYQPASDQYRTALRPKEVQVPP